MNEQQKLSYRLDQHAPGTLRVALTEKDVEEIMAAALAAGGSPADYQAALAEFVEAKLAQQRAQSH